MKKTTKAQAITGKIKRGPYVAKKDRLSEDKVRFNLVVRRDILDRFRKAAREKDMSVSQLVLRLAADGLDDAKQFEAFFADPAVRRLFADMMTRPGAMQALIKAAGMVEEPPKIVQDTIFNLLNGEPQKG